MLQVNEHCCKTLRVTEMQNLRSRTSKFIGCRRPSSICLSIESVTSSDSATAATSDDKQDSNSVE